MGVSTGIEAMHESPTKCIHLWGKPTNTLPVTEFGKSIRLNTQTPLLVKSHMGSSMSTDDQDHWPSTASALWLCLDTCEARVRIRVRVKVFLKVLPSKC